jgi:hypothetical protein
MMPQSQLNFDKSDLVRSKIKKNTRISLTR